MLAVRVEIVRYVDNYFPGIVECQLMDARGREWLFIEKAPIVSSADLDEDSAYPQPGIIACRVVERRQELDGRQVVVIDTETPWHVESTSGETRFDVLATQLVDFEAKSDAGDSVVAPRE